MGGPMGVGDVDDPRYPFLAPEIALIREAIARDRPVLGICLGAQLIAAAAGARVYPNTRRVDGGGVVAAREVGWGARRLRGWRARAGARGHALARDRAALAR
jgi:GMP synthase (glutamine-hydrolysing)